MEAKDIQPFMQFLLFVPNGTKEKAHIHTNSESQGEMENVIFPRQIT